MRIINNSFISGSVTGVGGGLGVGSGGGEGGSGADGVGGGAGGGVAGCCWQLTRSNTENNASSIIVQITTKFLTLYTPFIDDRPKPKLAPSTDILS